MSKKLKVGILGGTGMVGQRFIALLENHPWFEVTTIAASPRSAGKTYAEAVGDRWKMDTPMPEAVKNIVVMNVNEVEKVASRVDFVFSAVDMTKEEIKKIEEDYAKTETPVVSNNSAHRWTPDVPMVVPEINPDHIEIIKAQRERLGTKRGLYIILAVQGFVIQGFLVCAPRHRRGAQSSSAPHTAHFYSRCRLSQLRKSCAPIRESVGIMLCAPQFLQKMRIPPSVISTSYSPSPSGQRQYILPSASRS